MYVIGPDDPIPLPGRLESRTPRGLDMLASCDACVLNLRDDLPEPCRHVLLQWVCVEEQGIEVDTLL